MKSMRASSIFWSLVCTVLGGILAWWPGESFAVLCYGLGGLLIAAGLCAFIYYMRNRHHAFWRVFALIIGVVIIVVGVVLIFNTELVKGIIPTVFGAVILVNGCLNFTQTIRLGNGFYGRWYVALFVALITIAGGILIILHPGMAGNLLIRAIGIVLIFNGLSNIWICTRMSPDMKHVAERLRVVDAEGRIIEKKAPEKLQGEVVEQEAIPEKEAAEEKQPPADVL